jgi:hypothetical protein
MADFSLTAIFGMDSSGVKTELKSLKRSVLSFAEDFAKLGAAAGVGAFVALSKGAMELAGSLADASANIGINVESLQALQAQHKRNGVSNEELTKALEKTKAAVISAAEGDIKAEAALRKLGLASADLIKLPLAEQYAAIAKGDIGFIGRGASAIHQRAATNDQACFACHGRSLQVFRMILPRCALAFICAKASTASSSANTRSIGR